MLNRTALVSVIVLGLSLTAMSGVASAQWERMSEDQLRAGAEQMRGRNKCSDLWIDYAFAITSAGIESPQPSDCNIGNYNRGQWNSLTELVTLVDCYKRGGRRSCDLVEYAYRTSNPSQGIKRIETLANGNPIGYFDINVSTNRIVAAGGGNIVAAGGGNIVAAGGGNLIGNDGASIVAAGGGNFQLMSTGSTRRIGRGLYQSGAAVRGKETPKLELKVGEEQLVLVGNPTGQPGAPAAPAKK